MSASFFPSSTIFSKTPNFPKKIQNSSNPQTQPNSHSISSHPTPQIHEKTHKFKPNSPTRTAPWMKAPLVLEPNQVLDFSKPKNKNKSSNKAQDSLTRKVSGGRGKQAMKKILHGIHNLEEENQQLDQNELHLSLGKLSEDSLTQKVSGGSRNLHNSDNLEEENQEFEDTQKKLDQIDLSLGKLSEDQLNQKASGGRGILHNFDNLDEENQELEDTQKKLDQTKLDLTLGTLSEDPLTQKVSGGRRILHNFDNLEEESQELEDTQKRLEQIELDLSLGKLNDDSFTQKVSGGRGILCGFRNVEEENQELEDTQKRLEQIELDLSLGRLSEVNDGGKGRFLDRKMPWEREERILFRRVKREKVLSAAELSLDGVLLERLRSEARKMRNWVKVKKAGVNDGVIEQVRSVWKTHELAMLKFDLPLCRNMDRAREIVELKTGGLVIWSKKDILVVYRGCNYGSFPKTRHALNGGQDFSSTKISHHGSVSFFHDKLNTIYGETVPVQGSLYEREANRILDGLGPRYIDWWMPKPLPIDADLLPAVVPGYKPPLRQSLMNARSKLTDDELTYLRKLAYPLPTHFVLGRNRNLQGLASAILKLWEKCHIAKLALKWGVPNTNNEQMALELKILTGGVLLLRNKFYIILYRGKDFLPPRVASLVSDREMELKSFQLQEEAARGNTIETFYYSDETTAADVSTVGTLTEFKVIQLEHSGFETGLSEAEVQLEAEKLKLEKEIRNQQRKLLILKTKINKASKELAKLDLAWKPVELYEDWETITKEERECFRKMGRKMDSSLLLGRRGVFDGVMEGLHQHWKHREIVKVITMQRAFSKILYTAQCLEAESGGILVSIEKLKRGYGIIMYRGKNYKRPLKSPRRLLSKREALHKSLEMQRIGSLKFFANMRKQAIYELKCKLAKLQKERS